MDKREFLLFFLGRETVSAATKKAAGGVDDLGDSMQSTAKDAERLDAEVEAAQKALAGLAQQYARTTDAAQRMDLTRAMRKQQTEIRRTIKARDLLPPDLGDDAAKGFGARFVGRLGPLVASAPISPALVSALGPAIPIISAGVAAAVTGGVALAVAGGGVAMAFRDERVAAEAQVLGDEIGRIMAGAAEPFVPATLDAIGKVRAGFRSLEPDFRALGRDAAEYVEPLTDGLVGGATSLVGSLREVVAEAEPVVEVLGKHGTRAAAALGTSLELLSEDAEHTAGALDGILTTVEGALVGVSALIGGINKLGASMDTAGHAANALTPLGTILGSPLILVKELGDAIDGDARKLKTLGEQGASAAEQLNDGFEQTDEEAEAAADSITTLANAIREMSTENLDARAATREMEAAIDDAAAAARENGRTLDENSAKGRANAAALDAIAESTMAARDAIIKTSGSQGEAAEVTERGRSRFIALAQSMGASATEAKRLADQLFGIPSVNPKVKVDASSGKAAVTDFLRGYQKLKDKSIRISGTVHWTSKGLKVPGGTILEMAEGGRVEGPGPKGKDSVALLAAPGEHVLTASEVDAAGGHAAIERWRKSLTSGAAGRAAAPAPVGGAPAAGGVQVVEHRHTIVLQGTGVLREFRREILVAGPEVTLGIRAEVVR